MDGGGRRPKLEAGRLAVALHHGAKVPLDVALLQAAETWGCPPWEIEDAPGAIRWLKMLELYQQARARAQKMASAKGPD